VSRVYALVLRELFLFLAGWFFFSLVVQFVAIVESTSSYAAMMQNRELMDRLNLNDLVISGLFGNFLVLYVFLIPVLTMRSFAEERKQGTDELLLTAPVTPGQVVAGKYIGQLAVTMVLVLAAGFYVAVLFHYGDPEKGPIATGLIGLALVVLALTALGFAVSTVTNSQVVAAVSSFVLFLLLFVVDWPAGSTEGTPQAVLKALSLPAHFEGFARGNVASVDVVYFLSLAAVGLFTARAAIASQRFR
jgi:ABC-2 type transport system permease protein